MRKYTFKELEETAIEEYKGEFTSMIPSTESEPEHCVIWKYTEGEEKGDICGEFGAKNIKILEII